MLKGKCKTAQLLKDSRTAILYGKFTFPGLGWMQMAGHIDFTTDGGLLIGLLGKTSQDFGKGENKQYFTFIHHQFIIFNFWSFYKSIF